MNSRDANLQYRYENRLRNYYKELVRRQRHGLPMTPSADEVSLFIAELRALVEAQRDQRVPKAA